MRFFGDVAYLVPKEDAAERPPARPLEEVVEKAEGTNTGAYDDVLPSPINAGNGVLNNDEVRIMYDIDTENMFHLFAMNVGVVGHLNCKKKGGWV